MTQTIKKQMKERREVLELVLLYCPSITNGEVLPLAEKLFKWISHDTSLMEKKLEVLHMVMKGRFELPAHDVLPLAEQYFGWTEKPA